MTDRQSRWLTHRSIAPINEVAEILNMNWIMSGLLRHPSSCLRDQHGFETPPNHGKFRFGVRNCLGVADPVKHCVIKDNVYIQWAC